MPISHHGINWWRLALLFWVFNGKGLELMRGLFLCKAQSEIDIEAAVREPMACA